jgi:DNA-binding CsgD family transcriptional regulator
VSTNEGLGAVGQGRQLAILQRLLALPAIELKPALDMAARAIAEAMAADKVDIFLHEPTTEALVAVGTVDTPLGLRQQELGLDRLAIAEGGFGVAVFRTGRSRRSGHLEQDPTELRGIVEGLGVRSQLAVPLVVEGERRGVLMICSATPAFFSDADLDFAEAVGHWVGLVGARAVLVERLVSEVAAESFRAAAEEVIRVLTPRQREVAALIAAGHSNAQIADRLVIAEGTVANHVEQILRRLDFRSRTQIGVWASERGLHPPADGS